jgi:hypothetical protein
MLMYFQCTILRQVVVVMGAGIGKSVKYRSESPSRRTSAAKLHIPQQLCCAGGGRHYAAVAQLLHVDVLGLQKVHNCVYLQRRSPPDWRVMLAFKLHSSGHGAAASRVAVAGALARQQWWLQRGAAAPQIRTFFGGLR